MILKEKDNSVLLNGLKNDYEFALINESLVSLINSGINSDEMSIETYYSYIDDILVYFDKKISFLKYAFRENYMILQTLKNSVKRKIETDNRKDFKKIKVFYVDIKDVPNYKKIDNYFRKLDALKITKTNISDVRKSENNMIAGLLKTKGYDLTDKKMLNKKIKISNKTLDFKSKYEFLNYIENSYKLYDEDFNAISSYLTMYIKPYFRTLKSIHVGSIINPKNGSIDMDLKKLYKCTDAVYRVINSIISALIDAFNVKNTKVYESLKQTISTYKGVDTINENNNLLDAECILCNARDLLSEQNYFICDIEYKYIIDEFKKCLIQLCTTLDDEDSFKLIDHRSNLRNLVSGLNDSVTNDFSKEIQNINNKIGDLDVGSIPYSELYLQVYEIYSDILLLITEIKNMSNTI